MVRTRKCNWNETVSKQFQNSFETVKFQLHFVVRTVLKTRERERERGHVKNREWFRSAWRVAHSVGQVLRRGSEVPTRISWRSAAVAASRTCSELLRPNSDRSTTSTDAQSQHTVTARQCNGMIFLFFILVFLYNFRRQLLAEVGWRRWLLIGAGVALIPATQPIVVCTLVFGSTLAGSKYHNGMSSLATDVSLREILFVFF